MGADDKSRKGNASSWRERIPDAQPVSRAKSARRKRQPPRPSYPGLPGEEPRPGRDSGPHPQNGRPARFILSVWRALPTATESTPFRTPG